LERIDGAIQAESYVGSYKASDGGSVPAYGVNPRFLGYNISDWVTYNINVLQAGVYRLKSYAGAPFGSTAAIAVINNSNGVELCRKALAISGDWMTFVPTEVGQFSLVAGETTIKLMNVGGGCYFDYFTLERIDGAIQAESYVGSYKASDGGSVPAYGVNPRFLGYNINDWVTYNVNIASKGIYRLTASIGAPANHTVAIAVINNSNGVELCRKALAISGDWFTFVSTEVGQFYLPAGPTTIKLLNNGGGCYFDYFILEKAGDALFVSENGDDNGTGQQDSPFKTIGRAKQEIAATNASMSDNIIVNILPGYYKLDATEIFGIAHSGKNGYNVIFRGTDPLSPPIISGGTKITGWTLWSNGIWRAPVTGVAEIRNLYINGIPATRARSEFTYQSLGEYSDSNGTGFTVSHHTFPPSFAHPEELELVWELYWCNQRTPVVNIVRETDRVIMLMKQPCFSMDTGTPQVNPSTGSRFFIENAIELLDKPGEFYYNKTEGMIYYYPYEQENLSETYVGSTEFMFKIAGESPDNRVSNIVFDNLDIRYGAWNDVSENGLIGIQADQILDTANGSDAKKMMPAQFTVEKASNIVIKNCKFSCLGSAAISMVDAVSNSNIEGNVIKDISATGVIIGTWDHATAVEGMKMCENINVNNNVFRRVANEYRGCTAISAYYENSINIRHNDIKEIPYTGITVGWGWGYRDVVNCGNINISNNRIDNTMYTLYDGGPIYTLGPLRSSVISNNYLLNSNYYVKGVYTDSGSAYLNINNNVMDCGSGNNNYWWFMGFNYTHDMLAQDNFITPSINNYNGINNIIQNTTVVTGEWPAMAQNIIANTGVEAKYAGLLSGVERPAWRESIIKTPKTPYTTGYLVEAEDFVNSYDPTTGTPTVVSDGANEYVSFNPPEWMEYHVNVNESGTYTLTAFVAIAWGDGRTATIAVLMSDVEQCRGAINETPSWHAYMPNVIGQINLTAGMNTIKILNCGGGFHFNFFTLEK
jgi:hypothetical protein